MTPLLDKEALYEKYKKETERLHNEILKEKIDMLQPMMHKAFFCKDINTHIFITHISENKTIPFGLSISSSEIMDDWMVNPEKWVEIPVEYFFDALDKFVEERKARIRNLR